MATRNATARAAACAAAVILISGCASTTAGSPRAATTYAVPSSSSAPQTTSAPVPQSTPSAASTPTPASTVPVPSSQIRPMPPLTGGSSPSAPSPTGPATSVHGGQTVAGVDIGTVLDDLSKDHVAGVQSKADLTKLAALADAARGKGLLLWIVSIGSKVSDKDTSTIVDQVFATTGGTVITLTPSLIISRSDQLTDTQRRQADEAAVKGKTDVQAVTNFVDSALRGTAVATSASKPGATVEGVPIEDVVAGLADDHIAIENGVTDTTPDELAPAIKRATAAKLDLSIVVLKKDVSGHLYNVANAVMAKTGGTVVVMSPTMYAISSDTATDQQMNAALDAAADASSYVKIVEAMVTSLIG